MLNVWPAAEDIQLAMITPPPPPPPAERAMLPPPPDPPPPTTRTLKRQSEHGEVKVYEPLALNEYGYRVFARGGLGGDGGMGGGLGGIGGGGGEGYVLQPTASGPTSCATVLAPPVLAVKTT
jgi:hypothetical protein